MARRCRRKMITGQLENSTRISYCDTISLQSSIATMASTAMVSTPQCTSIDPTNCPHKSCSDFAKLAGTAPHKLQAHNAMAITVMAAKGGSVCSTQASAASCSWLYWPQNNRSFISSVPQQ
ncbi:hypothetical protein TRVL_10156 [Trypanosoma vivax]|nr:hypothetical protein TRVL_10156 [Trypanosoma vivax]